jgi:uncharacterized protein YaiI (UPF0178 family)
MILYVDGDACPVKEEAYRVAGRHEVPVIVVANSWMRVPDQGVRLEVVSNGFDAADDWIVEQCGTGDIVITGDIPLADRCLKKGAFVLGPKGEPFTEDNIGTAMVSREMTADMRAMGMISGGPAPFQKKDRGVFLQELDKAVVRLKRKYKVT